VVISYLFLLLLKKLLLSYADKPLLLFHEHSHDKNGKELLNYPLNHHLLGS